jgi:hypothetical protein
MTEFNKTSRAILDECIARLSSSDPEERETAAGKLGFFGGDAVDAIPSLKQALIDPVKEVRYAAGIALGAILEPLSESIEPAKAALAAIRRMFANDDEESTRGAISAIQRFEVSLGEFKRKSRLAHELPKSVLTDPPDFERSPPVSTPRKKVKEDRMVARTEYLESPKGFHRRAIFAFNDLQNDEQAQILDTVARISSEPMTEWGASVHRLSGEQPDYLVRVNENLRMIVRIDESRELLVLDLVRRDTLKMFGALQDVQ